MKRPVHRLNLYTRRNSLVPIHRLPTETLTNIFILCARDLYYSENPDCEPSWVDISHVCRRWRNLALDCPTLWSYISVTSRCWTKELLARSKHVPLKINANLEKISRHFFRRMMDHIERIEELCLHFPCTDSDDSDSLDEDFSPPFLTKFLSTPVPRLQNLELSHFEMDMDSSWLPFSGCTPALHTLKLSSCSMPLDSFTLSGLTTLTLHDVPSEFRLEMEELLATLNRIPYLVHLDLDDALASARDFFPSDAYATPSPRVNLPCLASVTIADSLSAIVEFLSCVDIPLSAKLILEQVCDSNPPPALTEYTQLSSLLLRRFGVPGDLEVTIPVIRSLIFEIDIHPTTLIFSASERISPNEQDPQCPLKVTLLPIDIDEDQVIRAMCRSIPPTNLRTLLLTNPPLSSSLWQSILEWFANVRCIKLEEGYFPNDFATLLSYTPYDGRLCEKLVPLLKELELHDVTLRNADDDVVDLQDALSTRTESQCKLIMTECPMPSDRRYTLKVFELIGWWESGTFRVASQSHIVGSDDNSAGDGDEDYGEYDDDGRNGEGSEVFVDFL